MSQLKRDFGKRLAALRNDKQISQERLADDVDLTVESISNIERGIFGPKFDNLEKIAKALGVPVYQLFIFGSGSE